MSLPQSLALVAAGLAISACAGPESSTSPIQRVRVESAEAPISSVDFLTPDDLMAAIATRGPGFAGMFWDSAGRLVIRTTPFSDPSVVVAAISDPETGGRFRGVHDALLASRFYMVSDAAFDFCELLGWRDSLRPVLRGAGVTYLSIDERRNRVRIGTVAPADEDHIRNAALGLVVPTAALVFERGARGVKETSLRDYFDSIPGGVKVHARWYPTSGYGCTVGANVVTEYGTGFVTVSHCSRTPWHVDTVKFYQPAYDPNDRVGLEVVDPTSSQLGRWCDPYDQCRLTDARFVLYDDSDWGEVGHIARTEGFRSITIDTWHPRFEIGVEGGWLLTGADIDKIGQSTGWTWGEVTETCVDAVGWFDEELETETVLECQTEADYGSDEGDSGAPIFTWDLSGDEVTLEGIHVGRHVAGGVSLALFSPWTSVALELGSAFSLFTPVQ